MVHDIRVAALDTETLQRVRLAITLLDAYRLRTRVSEWDGTRCDLLITASDDPYGQKALLLAQRRGTPLIALGDADVAPSISQIPLATPPATITRLIRERLTTSRISDSSRGDAPVRTPQPALCQLASPSLRGRTLKARRNGRTLYLIPKTGRVYARTHSDLVSASGTLAELDWNIFESDPPTTFDSLVATSLEAFLMQAANSSASQLPDFPEGSYRLDTWPDLGSQPDLVRSLEIAGLLTIRPRSVADLLAFGGGMERDVVHGSLWALAAANLLRDFDPSSQIMIPSQRPQRVESGVWSRLARRFGLGRTSR